MQNNNSNKYKVLVNFGKVKLQTRMHLPLQFVDNFHDGLIQKQLVQS